jgi:hypothetical protein
MRNRNEIMLWHHYRIVPRWLCYHLNIPKSYSTSTQNNTHICQSSASIIFIVTWQGKRETIASTSSGLNFGPLISCHMNEIMLWHHYRIVPRWLCYHLNIPKSYSTSTQAISMSVLVFFNCICQSSASIIFIVTWQGKRETIASTSSGLNFGPLISCHMNPHFSFIWV